MQKAALLETADRRNMKPRLLGHLTDAHKRLAPHSFLHVRGWLSAELPPYARSSQHSLRSLHKVSYRCPVTQGNSGKRRRRPVRSPEAGPVGVQTVGASGVLANAEKIYGAAMSAFDLLYDDSTSTSASLRAAQKHIEELARYEPKFQEAVAALESAQITVEDVGVSLRDYAGGIEASPEHLAEIEDRLAAMDRLKRKYGSTLEEVIKYGEEVSRKVAEMENKDEVLLELNGKLAEAAQQYLQAARTVSKKRHEAASKLEKSVEAAINELAMKVNFRIEVGGADDDGNWSASGFDAVLYMISTNPGEPLRRLEQIASGGEMSRVMLTLKTSVEAGYGALSTSKNGKGRTRRVQRTMVFDEIDTGIGGRAAEAVGKKLKALSRANQVLCVTHLPQIATFADHHYTIEKKENTGRTRTVVRRITGEERTEEVARMLSGAKLTEMSRKHAEQMLKANA